MKANGLLKVKKRKEPEFSTDFWDWHNINQQIDCFLAERQTGERGFAEFSQWRMEKRLQNV